MDIDPPGTLDFIWYKGQRITVKGSYRLGDKCDPKDPTIYGSDHYPLITDFEISSL